jgi:hypothetical protein
MKSSIRTLILTATSILFATAYTLGVHGSTVAVGPDSPSILVGASVSLTQTGAVIPVSISTGAWHTCVFYSDQSIRCTGLNNQGEIGNNDYHSV